MTKNEKPSELMKAMAKVCVACPVCRHARKKDSGFFKWSVKNIEGKICPFCIAYERVTGKPAHEGAQG